MPESAQPWTDPRSGQAARRHLTAATPPQTGTYSLFAHLIKTRFCIVQIQFLNERPAPDVQVQPEVQLDHWRILQRGNGTLHIVAMLGPTTLRVTSALAAIDLASAMVKTGSGRNYHLAAAPEEDEDLRMLMELRGKHAIGTISDDVSDIVWHAVSAGSWPDQGGGLLPPWQ